MNLVVQIIHSAQGKSEWCESKLKAAAQIQIWEAESCECLLVGFVEEKATRLSFGGQLVLASSLRT